jgi:hypothetical protein
MISHVIDTSKFCTTANIGNNCFVSENGLFIAGLAYKGKFTILKWNISDSKFVEEISLDIDVNLYRISRCEFNIMQFLALSTGKYDDPEETIFVDALNGREVGHLQGKWDCCGENMVRRDEEIWDLTTNSQFCNFREWEQDATIAFSL